MLLVLVDEKLVLLGRYRNNIFISENHHAYGLLVSLGQKHTWINRSCFFDVRPSLKALPNANVTYKQFYDFINEFRTSLEELKRIKESQEDQKKKLLVEEKEPHKDTNSGTVDPNNVETPKTAYPKFKRRNNYNSETNDKVVDKGNSQKRNQQRNRPNTHTNNTSKPKPKPVVKKVSPPSSARNSAVVNIPLPDKGPRDELPKRESKADLEAFVRKDDNKPNEKRMLTTNPKLTMLEKLSRKRVELSKSASLKISDYSKFYLINDLAMLDLLFKINREIFLDKDNNHHREIYCFDCDLIHGIYNYLKEGPLEHSDLNLFVQNCFDFDSEDPSSKYLNGLARLSHPFVSRIKDISCAGTIDRLKLIKTLYKLQKDCYALTQESNDELKQMGRHALSAIMIILGEQYAKLDYDIRERLFIHPFGKLLNSYRLYRNKRHGNDDVSKTVMLDDLDFEIVFNLEREDWDQSLVHLISNFDRQSDKYMNEESSLIIDKFINELEEKSEYEFSNTYLPRYVTPSSSQTAPLEEDVDEKFRKMRLNDS